MLKKDDIVSFRDEMVMILQDEDYLDMQVLIEILESPTAHRVGRQGYLSKNILLPPDTNKKAMLLLKR